MLEGLERLLGQGHFSECSAAKMAVEQYRVESDSVQMFLNELDYSISTLTEIPLKDMYADYRVYCMDSGFRPVSNRTFSDRLKMGKYSIRKTNKGQVVGAIKGNYF